MHYIDANIILRYILNDHPELSAKAKKIIGENVVVTPVETLCEVVFVLTKVYAINRKEIAETLLDFYETTNCVLPHREAVKKGIVFFGEKNLDFVDCIFAGYYAVENTPVYTFDKDLEKLLLSLAKSPN
jgi:predicted nucleic acid-binding protein